jgi:hypothetical protein
MKMGIRTTPPRRGGGLGRFPVAPWYRRRSVSSHHLAENIANWQKDCAESVNRLEAARSQT